MNSGSHAYPSGGAVYPSPPFIYPNPSASASSTLPPNSTTGPAPPTPYNTPAVGNHDYHTSGGHGQGIGIMGHAVTAQRPTRPIGEPPAIYHQYQPPALSRPYAPAPPNLNLPSFYKPAPTTRTIG